MLKLKQTGKSDFLKTKLNHYTYADLSRYIKKANYYSTWGAYERVEKVKKVTLYHLLIKPAARFSRHYAFRLGFLDGRVGFIISVLSAQQVFMRNLKLWRIKNGEEFDKSK